MGSNNQPHVGCWDTIEHGELADRKGLTSNNNNTNNQQPTKTTTTTKNNNNNHNHNQNNTIKRKKLRHGDVSKRIGTIWAPKWVVWN